MAFEFNDFLNKLPKPLEKEEQNKLFFQLDEARKLGKVEDYISIREKLINHNLRFCFYIVCKNFKCVNHYNYNFEDLMSDAIVGLANAIDNFDLSKGFEFSTFAYKFISMGLVTVLDKRRLEPITNATDVNVFKNVSKDNTNEGSVWDVIVDESESNIAGDFADKEFVRDVLRFINRFPERERKIFKMYTELGVKRKYTQEEIAEVFNSSQPSISRIIRQLQEECKKYVNENYGIRTTVNKKDNKARDDMVLNLYFGLNGEKILSRSEIIKITNISPATLVNITKQYINNQDKRTKDFLKQKRKKELEERRLKMYKKYYISYYGLLGNTKKTLRQMAIEEGITHHIISNRVKWVEKYLQTLTDEERERFFDESQNENVSE